ncbi:hypothetical protein [Paraflavitalea speifideaquila]|uniref:hypothetical protein n=1 Tax=Paraflavitalea speifideaquila TaxID=3076558 RepID=UPI0028E8F934|nr:hypothetical protein [Paraflavitalea speifideiaquila]
MANKADILFRLRDYEVQPPPEAFDNLLTRLEAGAVQGIDQEWQGAWQGLQALEMQPPAFLSARIAGAITEQPLLVNLQQMVVAPPAAAFKQILERLAGEEDGVVRPAVRKLFTPFRAIAAVLLLVIGGVGMYYLTRRAPTVSTGPELVQQTKPLQPVPAADTPRQEQAAPAIHEAARYQEYDNVKTENYFKNARFTAEGDGMALVDNDFLVTFASYQYETLPAFLAEEEDSEMKIRLDQYSYFTISENMMNSLKKMYQRRSRGTPTRRARKEKEKLEEWKQADETWFDLKQDKNPLDAIDLAEFIFKR